MTAEPKAALKYKSSSDTRGQSEAEKRISTGLQAGCACFNNSLFTRGEIIYRKWIYSYIRGEVNQNKAEPPLAEHMRALANVTNKWWRPAGQRSSA